MRRSHSEVRETILKAASESFENRGYRETKMSDIASDCSISKKTLYVHFPSKEELLNEVLIREITRFRVHVFEDIGSELTYSAKIHRVIENGLAYFDEHPLMIKLYWAAGGLWATSTPPGLEKLMVETFSIVRELIYGGIIEEEFEPVNPDTTALILLNSFISLFLGELDTMFEEVSLETLLHQGVELLMDGILVE